MILELQVLLFILYFLHVMFSNHIEVIYFLFIDEEEEEGGEVRWRSKTPASETKRYVVFSLYSTKICLGE